MPKIKTSELTGAALDWAVAGCEGRTIRRDPMGFCDRSFWIWEEVPSGRGGILIDKSVYMKIGSTGEKGYSPSTKWEQGGLIIDRERITTGFEAQGLPADGQPCFAYQINHLFDDDMEHLHQKGPTPLIAAMRHYVASRLGEEVEIPDELIKEI